MELVSEQTKRNIAAAFRNAASTRLVRDGGDNCNIVAADDRNGAAPLDSNLVVITISSWVFRLLTIFQVSQCAATRDYYIGESAQALDEAFAEFANLCCGTLNRELSSQFRHLAMSIPYVLSQPCIGFLDQLNPQYRARFEITINQSVRLQATLCLCCQAPVEFTPSATEVTHDGGELEMF